MALLDKERDRHGNTYNISYTLEPGQSFVVRPEGGELDYDLAR